MLNFKLSTMPADDLAPLGARSSVETVMIECGSLYAHNQHKQLHDHIHFEIRVQFMSHSMGLAAKFNCFRSINVN